MNRLLEFLFKNPLVLFVLLAWVGGMIGNARRAARRREEARRPPAPTPVSSPRTDPAAQRSAEEVAREMRRILGMEDGPVTAPGSPRREEAYQEPSSYDEARQDAPRAPRLPGTSRHDSSRHDVVEPERPPLPVVPSTQNRRLHLHEASHVGERIAQRSGLPGAKMATPLGERAIGSLGGRVHAAPTVRRGGNRLIDLGDLKRAFVMNEILGKPLALRSRDEQL